VVLPDILLQLSFRRFKLESRKAGHLLLLRCSIHKESMYKQDHCIPYLFQFVCLYTYEFWLSLCKIVRSSVILLLPLINYSTLYSTAITWLQVYARPSIQLHYETTNACLLFKAIQTSCASFLILCEGDTRDGTTFVSFRDVE
jgi:prepilin signal peptidase PulO-like enzyme (type II secretory pathway)